MNKYGTFDQAGYVPFKNDGSEKIPPFAPVRITGTKIIDGDLHLLADKPNTYGSQYSVFINGPTGVAAGKIGLCTAATLFPVQARIVSGSAGSPDVGDLCGPTDDDWSLTRYVGGFKAWSEEKDGRLFVMREPLLMLRGKAASACDKNDDGTMTVKNAGGTTSHTVPFENELGDILHQADMVVSWIDNAWYAIGAECEVS